MNPSCPLNNDPRFVGDPVDTLTGAVVEKQRDFRLAGHLPFQWWRLYDSSKSNRYFSLGRGQTHGYDCKLRFDQDGILFRGPLGDTTHFAPFVHDGQNQSFQGRTMRRIEEKRYLLSEHGSPDREFVFDDLRKSAPLTRLIQGENSIEFQYSSMGRLEMIFDSLGNYIEVHCNEAGLITSLSFPKTRTRERRDLISYEYDPFGNLVRGWDGFSSSFSMEYDSSGRLTSKTDRIGHTFEFSYDAFGRCTRTAGTDGVLDHRIAYVRPGELTQVTRGNGGVWQYRYQLGKLTCIADPLGGEQKFVYDDSGKLTVEIDTNGNATKIISNSSGTKVGKVDPLGHFRAEPVDLNAPNPLHHRVAQNAAEYEFGRLINIESIASIAVAKPSIESDPNERNVRPSSYVEKANLYSSSNLGFVVGSNWWPEPSSGRQFDATGDLIHQVDRKGRMRRWMYDGNGNVTKYVDFDGGVWKYEYHSWNHLVRETNPIGIANRMEYDSQENLTAFVDRGGTRSEYGYNLKDVLVEVRRHGQLRERYERDTSGNLLKKYAADGGLLIELEYGPGNLPVKRILSSGDICSYAYDSNGRYLVADTQKDAIAFEYDLLGNRCVEKRNGQGVVHRYRGWRQFGESLWLDKFEIRHAFADDGTLVITDPLGGKQRVKILVEGTVERRFSNGTVETIKYDELGRCESKLVERQNHVRWSREYGWSGEGELRLINDSLRGTSIHAYDVAHRLRSRTLSNGVREEFDFDPANNLLRQPGLIQVTIQSGNRILTANGETFAYNNRNHISSRSSSNDTIQYFYDSRDQLVRVESGKGIWEAEYDAMGRRVRKTFNGLTTEYLWNTDQLAGEISPDGSLRLYIYVDAFALTPLMFVEYESIKAEPTSGKRFLILNDQIGTPICVEDAFGNVVWEACVEPFGEAKLSPSNCIEFQFRFPGHYWDDDILLNYNRFRFYDPRLGRYIQSDPIGIAGGDNVYAYPCNPIGDVDPLGLNCPTCGGDHPDDPDCEGTKKSKSKAPADMTPAELDAAFGTVQPATKIKDFEKNPDGSTIRNPDLHEVTPTSPPTLDPNKQYLWLVDSNGRLFVGTETPVGEPLKDGYQPKLGHPTLVDGQPARMGGELKPNPDGSWSVNNNSGRYSEHPDRGPAQLNNVNDRFVESGANMGPPQDNPNRRVPK